jgi:hypothetical protein
VTNPFCDGGKPGEGGREEVKKRNKILVEMAIAEQEYLSKVQQLIPYYYTHEAWDSRKEVCLTCMKTLVEIHHDKLRCKDDTRTS